MKKVIRHTSANDEHHRYLMWKTMCSDNFVAGSTESKAGHGRASTKRPNACILEHGE